LCAWTGLRTYLFCFQYKYSKILIYLLDETARLRVINWSSNGAASFVAVYSVSIILPREECAHRRKKSSCKLMKRMAKPVFVSSLSLYLILSLTPIHDARSCKNKLRVNELQKPKARMFFLCVVRATKKALSVMFLCDVY